ncbi:hypothetical protein CSKR_111050, partial [Clonorchis sinensis]
MDQQLNEGHEPLNQAVRTGHRRQNPEPFLIGSKPAGHCESELSGMIEQRDEYKRALQQLNRASTPSPDWRVNRSSQLGQLLGRRSMGRAHQSHRSSVNTFACSDVKIQMRPTCVGGVVVTRSPR